MAHGFNSYSDPQYGNLSSYIGGKIKDSFAMAADERRARDEEIKTLKKEAKTLEAKEERTEEEDERLNFLTKKLAKKQGIREKPFFGKALASQFGGDRKRRLMGTFSKNPDASQDPSLTKEERFSALLDRAEAPVAPAPGGGVDDDIDPMDYGDANAQAPVPQQALLDKLLNHVKSSYDKINAKVSALKSQEEKTTEEKGDENSALARITSTLSAIKNHFNTDAEITKEEINIEKEKLSIKREGLEDSKANAVRDQLADKEDLSSFSNMIDTREGGEKKGLLGNIMDGVGGLFKMFGKGGKSKGVMPQSKAYSSPIGPQPMNSSTPWARMGAGDRGGMFGGGQFTPRMSATKLSEGGIVDNPTVTTLNPGDSVIPLNRNNAMADALNPSGGGGPEVGLAQPMAEIIQLPTKVGGGLLIGLLSKVMDKLGGISSLLKPAIEGVAQPIAKMFGLPATIVSAMFGGGPAYAATLNDGLDISKLLGGTGLSIPGMSGSKTTGSPGAGPAAAPNLAGTGVVNEVSGSGLLLSAAQGGHADVGVTSGFGERDSPGGIGSTNHQGVDIGTSGKKGYKVAFKRGGTVTHAGTAGGFGNLVIIKDEDGTEYYFGHLANINPDIKVGAEYTGQTIGEIGNTGTGTGEHLHFEKHPNGGAAVDPINDIGLLSIGKQTQALPTNDAPQIQLAGLDSPEPQTPAVDPSLFEDSAPQFASIIKANQEAARQQRQQRERLTTPGLSGLFVRDPSNIDYSYGFRF